MNKSKDNLGQDIHFLLFSVNVRASSSSSGILTLGNMFASGVSDHYTYFKVDEKFLKEETIHAKGIHYHLCSKLELTKAPFQLFYIHSLDDVISNI